MIRNPFTECETSGAKITSRFWHVEAKNAAQAKRIADGWNIIMSSALDTTGYLTPAHVALMMDWLKTARLLGGDMSHDDSWTDKIGYSALGGEIAAGERK